MDISIGSYKVRVEILVAIVVIFWILFGHLLCGCCRMNLFEGFREGFKLKKAAASIKKAAAPIKKAAAPIKKAAAPIFKPAALFKPQKKSGATQLEQEAAKQMAAAEKARQQAEEQALAAELAVQQAEQQAAIEANQAAAEQAAEQAAQQAVQEASLQSAQQAAQQAADRAQKEADRAQKEADRASNYTVNEGFKVTEGFTGGNYTSMGPEFANVNAPKYIMNPSTWAMQSLTYSPGTKPGSGVQDFWNRQKQQIPPPEGQLDFFAKTEFKPECCPNSYSTSTGCACMDMGSYTFLKQRGFNNVPYSDF